MIIDIKQQKIAFGDKYKIFINEIPNYSASTKLFKWLPEIELIDLNKHLSIYKISKRWSWFNVEYNIYKNDYNTFEFHTINFWKNQYQCIVGKDTYDIIGHKWRKYSVFKNNIQIASWDQKALTWFEGDKYRILADKDSDIELIICFCLIIDNAKSTKNGNNALTINLGNLGFKLKEFDENWRAKE